MNTQLLTSLVLGSVISLVCENAHANLLTNGSFEMPDTPVETLCASGSFSVSGWGCFNNSLIVGPGAAFGAPVSHDAGGSQSLKLFGFDGGAEQSVPVTGGTNYEASVWAMNYSADPFNHLALLGLSFLDADGNLLGEGSSRVGEINGDSFQQLPSRDGAQVSDWTRLSVIGQAPAGATTAKVLLLHVFDPDDVNPASAIYFDDAHLSVADTDGDGVLDSVDNCTEVANADQYDSNGDNIGSLCDADIAGAGGADDCAVNFLDLNEMKAAFFSTPAAPNWNPDADLDNTGSVNFADLNIVKAQFFGPPGPSAAGCN